MDLQRILIWNSCRDPLIFFEILGFPLEFDPWISILLCRLSSSDIPRSISNYNRFNTKDVQLIGLFWCCVGFMLKLMSEAEVCSRNFNLYSIIYD